MYFGKFNTTTKTLVNCLDKVVNYYTKVYFEGKKMACLKKKRDLTNTTLVFVFFSVRTLFLAREICYLIYSSTI